MHSNREQEMEVFRKMMDDKLQQLPGLHKTILLTEYSISSLNFPKKSLFSLCVSGVLDTICKEKMVIYSQFLIIVTKLTLPSFNQHHFVTVSAYPNRKICYCLFILIITILTG